MRRLLSPTARADAYLAAKRRQPPYPGEELTLEVRGRGRLGWHAHDLKRLCVQVCDYMGISRRRTVEVIAAGRLHGRASIGGRHTILYLRKARPGDVLDVASVARVLLHEFQHNLGMDHYQMSSGSAGKYVCDSISVPMPGFEGKPVRNLAREAAPAAPPEERRAQAALSLAATVARREARVRGRLAAAEALVETYRADLARAKKRAAGLRAKVRYYDRKSRLAASPQGTLPRSVPTSGPGAPTDNH